MLEKWIKKRRLLKIKYLMFRLWKLNAIEKIYVDDMDSLIYFDKQRGIEYRWYVDFQGKYISGEEIN